ncbi:MAG TPA: HRDC domain-containing protein [Symbiobacteriaceae bacterium]|nr:HRDC domain-containing protein [Symbiobacteriaceae bacterium]
METVYSRLRAWRLNLALALRVPTYFILSNAHLAHVALVRPASPEELAACPGLGPKKLAQFGEALLAQVAAAVAEGLEPGVVPPPPPQVEPLSEAEVAEIMATLRQDLAKRIARQCKGRYSEAQVAVVLSRLSFSA